MYQISATRLERILFWFSHLPADPLTLSVSTIRTSSDGPASFLEGYPQSALIYCACEHSGLEVPLWTALNQEMMAVGVLIPEYPPHWSRIIPRHIYTIFQSFPMRSSLCGLTAPSVLAAFHLRSCVIIHCQSPGTRQMNSVHLFNPHLKTCFLEDLSKIIVFLAKGCELETCSFFIIKGRFPNVRKVSKINEPLSSLLQHK